MFFLVENWPILTPPPPPSISTEWAWTLGICASRWKRLTISWSGFDLSEELTDRLPYWMACKSSKCKAGAYPWLTLWGKSYNGFKSKCIIDQMGAIALANINISSSDLSLPSRFCNSSHSTYVAKNTNKDTKYKDTAKNVFIMHTRHNWMAHKRWC